MALKLDEKNEYFVGVEGLTLSHATLRLQDLLPVALEALGNTPESTTIRPIPDDILEDEYHEWWNGEEAHDLWESVWDLLNQYAPPGYGFGAHEGNGSLFGFWKYDEE